MAEYDPHVSYEIFSVQGNLVSSFDRLSDALINVHPTYDVGIVEVIDGEPKRAWNSEGDIIHD